MPSTRTAIRGDLVYFTGNPFISPATDCLTYERDGCIIVEDGLIQAVGPANALLEDGITVTHHRDKLILPGFIDTHTHYVQLEIMASFGKQLIDWLNQYTFPAEQSFDNAAHCDQIAAAFCDQLLRHGTTSASVFCSSHAYSAEALFKQASKRNMRMIAGQVLMDRNAPDALLVPSGQAHDESQKLIQDWHGKNRNLYAITPRFAPTSTPDLLEMAGDLWREHNTCHVQSHISENVAEVEWVRSLFPDYLDYLDVYEKFGLIGQRANFAHGIHLTGREIARLCETETAISHCPTSNLFLGSGIFDFSKMMAGEEMVRIGIGTDIGGGTSLSILETLAEAYKVSLLSNRVLSAAEAFYAATLGSAQALSIDDKVGTLQPGLEADLIVLDPKATPLLTMRSAQAQSIHDLLFALMIMGDDRAVSHTYVAGDLAHART